MNELASPRKSILPVIIGITVTAVLLVLLAYAAKRRTNELSSIPQLTLISPAAGAVLDTPFVITFKSSEPLSRASTGWGYRQLHLHGWLGNMQLMPAAADIKEVGESTYEWKITMRDPGPDRLLYLAWADASHHPIPEGASERISITTR